MKGWKKGAIVGMALSALYSYIACWYFTGKMIIFWPLEWIVGFVLIALRKSVFLIPPFVAVGYIYDRWKERKEKMSLEELLLFKEKRNLWVFILFFIIILYMFLTP